MSAHTPGPWQVLEAEQNKDYLRIRGRRLGGRYKIANVHIVRYVNAYPEVEAHELLQSVANARLIAAAPDLLESLRALQPFMDSLICYASTCGEHEPNRIVKMVNEAIFKATGAAA